MNEVAPVGKAQSVSMAPWGLLKRDLEFSFPPYFDIIFRYLLNNRSFSSPPHHHIWSSHSDDRRWEKTVHVACLTCGFSAPESCCVKFFQVSGLILTACWDWVTDCVISELWYSFPMHWLTQISNILSISSKLDDWLHTRFNLRNLKEGHILFQNHSYIRTNSALAD